MLFRIRLGLAGEEGVEGEAGAEAAVMRSGRNACVIEMYDQTLRSKSLLASGMDMSETGML